MYIQTSTLYIWRYRWCYFVVSAKGRGGTPTSEESLQKLFGIFGPELINEWIKTAWNTILDNCVHCVF